MHPSCHHMLGTSTGTPGSTALTNGFGPLGIGFGPLEMLGIFLLASLAFGFLLWLAQQRPSREGSVSAVAQQRLWIGEPRPEPPLQAWSSPPVIVQASYEQPQVHYPEMPEMQYERPRQEQTWEQYPEGTE